MKDNDIINICNKFYNTYKVLNKEYLQAQENKKKAQNKEDKNKYNLQAVHLNGLINENKFNFIDNLIKLYEQQI